MADITALCKRVLLIHQGKLFYDGALAGIVDRFAPYREVKLDFTDAVDAGLWMRLGRWSSAEGRSASFMIRREALTATVNRMMAGLPIADLTITDPPIENIIGELFAQGSMKGFYEGRFGPELGGTRVRDGYCLVGYWGRSLRATMRGWVKRG